MGLFDKQADGQDGRGDIDDLRARVQRLESAMVELAARQARVESHQGFPPGAAAGGQASYADDVVARVRALKQAGKTIDAIKLCREHTDLGLKEAKEFVDNL